jgi:dolichyl-phosphate beta-glucosyltransferase
MSVPGRVEKGKEPGSEFVERRAPREDKAAAGEASRRERGGASCAGCYVPAAHGDGMARVLEPSNPHAAVFGTRHTTGGWSSRSAASLTHDGAAGAAPSRSFRDDALLVSERRAPDEPALSIVIPAYDEAGRLAPTLWEAAAYFCEPIEIVVVDDGSRDGTAERAAKILVETPHAYAVVRHSRNHGKGCATRLGALHARGRRLLCVDADGATPIAEWEKLRTRLDAGADIVIGSRAMPASRIPIAQPWYRRPLGRAYNLFVRALLFRGIRDTQCGFKAFRSEAARQLFSRQRIDGFSFDPEVIFLALCAGMRVEEVGIVWNDRPHSKVSVPRDSLEMLRDLLRIRRYARRGAYDGGFLSLSVTARLAPGERPCL